MVEDLLWANIFININALDNQNTLLFRIVVSIYQVKSSFEKQVL